MANLLLLERTRVLMPGQRSSFRMHDQEQAAALAANGRFGNLFVVSSYSSEIGTEAEVVSANPVAFGRLDVEVIGRRRFEVIERGAGSVEYLAELPGDGDNRLLRDELEQAYRRFAAASVETGVSRRINSQLHPDPRLAAYQAAMRLGLSHPERQDLLELDSTSDRLRHMLRVAAGETSVLRHMLSLGRMQA